MSEQELRADLEATFKDLWDKVGGKPDEPSEEPSSLPEPPNPADVPDASIPSPEVTEVTEEDETYPGSRRVRRSVIEERAQPDDDGDDLTAGWDENPRVYLIRGREVELFTISALAQALGNRKPVTLRKWEDQGYFPPARFRGPGPEGKQPRLYTRAQIEGARALAKEEGLMSPHKKMRIDQTKFPDRVFRLFAALDQRSNA